jgi:hypothetical protein
MSALRLENQATAPCHFFSRHVARIKWYRMRLELMTVVTRRGFI